MSMAGEVIKLIFAVLDVSFNRGHYTVIIKRQFLYISLGQIFICLRIRFMGDSVAEWLAFWTQARKSMGSNRSRDAVG